MTDAQKQNLAQAYQSAYGKETKKTITDPKDPGYWKQYRSAHHAANDPQAKKAYKEHLAYLEQEYGHRTPMEKYNQFREVWSYTGGLILPDLPDLEQSLAEIIMKLILDIALTLLGIKRLKWAAKGLKWLFRWGFEKIFNVKVVNNQV